MFCFQVALTGNVNSGSVFGGRGRGGFYRGGARGRGRGGRIDYHRSTSGSEDFPERGGGYNRTNSDSTWNEEGLVLCTPVHVHVNILVCNVLKMFSIVSYNTMHCTVTWANIIIILVSQCQIEHTSEFFNFTIINYLRLK